MNIWQEIKSQPAHIREIFMWTCVVITFSVIGLAWFRSTTNQFLALVNPKEFGQSRILAEEKNKEQSPLATILVPIKDLKASILEIFSFVKNGNDFEIIKNKRLDFSEPVEPQELPVSD